MHTTHASLAGRVIVGGFDDTEVPPFILDRLRRGHLAGVTLFKRNITSIPQTFALCRTLASASLDGRSPIVSIDQEGGRVARLRTGIHVLPAMRLLGALDDVALTERAAAMVGRELLALGFNLNFAPVCDVDSNPQNPIIGDRAFGADPARVARHATAFIHGLQSAGVMGSAKHFPGHGDTESDSHLTLPRIRHGRDRMDAVELPPFRAALASGVATVMSAHVVFDALDPDRPATLSAAVMRGLLRESMGCEALIFSDDLHMKAVRDALTVAQSAVAAITAGCDALLVCTDPDSQEEARLALAARADEDPAFADVLRRAADRVNALRARWPLRPAADEAALRAVLEDPTHDALLREIAARSE